MTVKMNVYIGSLMITLEAIMMKLEVATIVLAVKLLSMLGKTTLAVNAQVTKFLSNVMNLTQKLRDIAGQCTLHRPIPFSCLEPDSRIVESSPIILPLSGARNMDRFRF